MWGTAILALGVAAVCAALEVAMLRANKLYVEIQRQQGAWWARLVAGPLDRSDILVVVLAMGSAIAVVVAGVTWTAIMGQSVWLAELPSPLRWPLAAAGTILLVLVLGEWLPDLIGRIDPHFTLRLCAVPLRGIHLVLAWPAHGFLRLSSAMLKVYGVRSHVVRTTFGRPDLDGLLSDQGKGGGDREDLEPEVEYFRNTLELSRTKVRDVMVPRADVLAIDADSAVADLHALFVSTGLSKLLVYKGGMDNIVGYVHGKELFRRPTSIREVMRPVHFLPGTMPADQALQLFTRQRTHVAVVVDEFGGTAGLLTIEDVVEAIVGEIEDEHDDDELVEEEVAPGRFAFSGRAEVEAVNARFGLQLPTADAYDTLAGLVLHRTGDIPQQGTSLTVNGYRITVAQVAAGRVDLLHVVAPGPGVV